MCYISVVNLTKTCFERGSITKNSKMLLENPFYGVVKLSVKNCLCLENL